LAEARAKATTLPRRAAVDPTAGAAERESAKFIVSERVDRGKERERERKGRTAREGKVNSQHYYFFEENEKDKQAPQTSRLHSLSSPPPFLLFLLLEEELQHLWGLFGLPSFLLLSFITSFVFSHLSYRGSNGTNARED